MALDKNQPTLQEYANDALKMARDSLHQRDVTVELYFADKRGSFFGTISVQNKGDFAVKLLDEGLAQVHLQGNAKAPANMMKYEEAEENAKSKEIGIWGGQLKLMSNQSQNGSNYECGQRIKVEMTDMLDATSFHVRDVGAGSAYAKIDEAMEHFDYQTAEELEKPIKKGTLCAALFATDSKWYRVKVLGAAGKGQVEVRFIDYGNVETVRAD
jgi:staphylococcal nuclease domain-containing protein 1